MQISVQVGSVETSTQVGEIYRLCDLTVLSQCPVLSFSLGHMLRSNRWTDFHALRLKRHVSTQEGAFWGCLLYTSDAADE